ncbi:MAG: hypothetical protein ACOX0O_09060 [Candidatus Methanoculleus thermohydrogenotrophicum]
MNPRHLFGISVLVAALLIVGAIFALAVSAEAVLSCEYCSGNTANSPQ